MKYFDRTLAELPADATFSAGPAPGFSKAFAAAYDNQTRNWSQFGLQFAFAEIEQEQLDRIYAATGERIPQLIGAPLFKALAKNFEGDAELDPEGAEIMQGLLPRMKRFAEIKKQHPDILTYDEMWAEVRERGRAAEHRAEKTDQLSGIGGWTGSLIGSMVGAFTYRDPLNLATLGLGGVGKSIGARLATEFGANAAVEAVNQYTGVQENRELIGLDHGTEQALAQIGMAGLGAATIRGGAEATAAVWRGLRRRFGTAASDVAAAAVAKDAEEIIGKSPFGSSRTAQGVHWAELRSVMREADAPLFTDRGRLLSSVSAGALASRDTDELFSGSSEPLADTLAKFFDVSREREFPMPGGFNRAEIADANRRIQELTDRVNVAETRGAGIDAQIAAVSPPLRPDDATAMVRRLAEVNQEIQAVEAGGLKARERKARLNKLGKEKAEIEATLTASQKAATDIRALTEQRARVTGEADDLRLRRAQIVADIARRAPAAERSEIDTKAIVAELLGRFPEEPTLISPTAGAAREFAEKIDAVQKTLDDAPPREPRIIAQTDGAERLDIGQNGEPIDLDFPIAVGRDDQGRPMTVPLREFLKEFDDDAALVRQMRECLI